MAWTEVVNPGGGMFFKWDTAGKSVEGRFLGVFAGNVFNGRQTHYARFVQSDGREWKVNTPTVLERRLREESVSVAMRGAEWLTERRKEMMQEVLPAQRGGTGSTEWPTVG